MHSLTYKEVLAHFHVKLQTKFEDMLLTLFMVNMFWLSLCFGFGVRLRIKLSLKFVSV